MPRKKPEGHPAPPVASVAQLLERAHQLEGIPLADLATYLQYPLRDPSKHKGYVGNLMQLAFGLPPNSRQEADLEQFRIEVKTVPVDTTLKALENTRLTKINPQQLCLEEEWTRSHAFRKVTTLLLVPVVKHPRPPANVGGWYARSPFVWMPSLDELVVLEKDWTLVRKRYEDGLVTRSAIPGDYMIANTQSKDSTVRETYTTAGTVMSVQPKAFYLRNTLITSVLRRTIAWEQLLTRPEREQEGIVAASDGAQDF